MHRCFVTQLTVNKLYLRMNKPSQQRYDLK
ncbi:Uncharacterised protein [Vibrio cholerae]|nr:Uncharacterised protein [Vibrio cholerae]